MPTKQTLKRYERIYNEIKKQEEHETHGGLMREKQIIKEVDTKAAEQKLRKLKIEEQLKRKEFEQKREYLNKQIEMEQRKKYEEMKRENTRLKQQNTRLKNDLNYYKEIWKSET